MKSKTIVRRERNATVEQETGWALFQAGQPLESCANQQQKQGWRQAASERNLLKGNA